MNKSKKFFSSNSATFKNKKGLEMGFSWMFALIVGAMILFLTIYGASKFIDVSERGVNTKTSFSFLNVLNEVQTTSEDGSSNVLPLNVETRFFASCESEGYFGESILETSERIGFGDTWSSKGGDVSSNNVYLYAEDHIEGEIVYFLTFPFKIPLKIGDISIAYTEPYCFVNPPGKIKNTVKALGDNANLQFTSNLDSCAEESISVCFSGSCDVQVKCFNDECSAGRVKKVNATDVFFEGNLVYGAIFSSGENYECNTKRLVKRLGHLSEIYVRKAELISVYRCDSGLRNDFISLKNYTSEYYGNSRDLGGIIDLGEAIDEINEVLECPLY